jgi:hypothetical protein
VFERDCSDCKCVEIFTRHIGSAGAPSRTVFIGGTNTKEWEVPKFAVRKTKITSSRREVQDLRP